MSDVEFARYTQFQQSQPSTSSSKATLVKTDNPVAYLSSSSRYWIIDSGATDHMTGDQGILSHYKPSDECFNVTLADGSTTKVLASGDTSITSSLPLSSVLYLPKFFFNLMSVSQITEVLNYCVIFFSIYCLFQDLSTRKILGKRSESK